MAKSLFFPAPSWSCKHKFFHPLLSMYIYTSGHKKMIFFLSTHRTHPTKVYVDLATWNLFFWAPCPQGSWWLMVGSNIFFGHDQPGIEGKKWQLTGIMGMNCPSWWCFFLHWNPQDSWGCDSWLNTVTRWPSQQSPNSSSRNGATKQDEHGKHLKPPNGIMNIS